MRDRAVTARPEDRKEILRLLERCFPEDSLEFRRAVMEYVFRPEETLVIRRGEELAAAVMLPTFRLDTGETFGYVYSLCTAPEYRGKGYMRLLLEKAHELCLRRGDSFTALVPANEALARTYEKAGYEPIAFCVSGGSPASALPGREGELGDIPFVNGIYEAEFSGKSRVGRDERLWRTLIELYSADGGGLRIFEKGYFFVERTERGFCIRERAGVTPECEAEFLLPADLGEPRVFARGAKGKRPVMNLLFD